MDGYPYPKNKKDVGWYRYDLEQPATIISKKPDGSLKNSKSEIDYWFHCITSPFQGRCFGYTIKPNFDSNVKAKFVCEYSAIVFDDVEVGIWGYGASPEIALEKCIRFVNVAYRHASQQKAKTKKSNSADANIKPAEPNEEN